MANCLEEHPDLNHLLRAGNLYRRARTDVFITTLLNTARGKDLSGFVLRDVPGHSLGEVARLSEEAVGRLRRGEDAETRRIDAMTARMPVWLLRLTMALQDFAHYTLNVSLRRFGIPDDRFGSVMISNFGVLGIDNALVPLSPYCRCPLIIGIGRPRPMPIVRNGAGRRRRMRHDQLHVRPPLRRRRPRRPDDAPLPEDLPEAHPLRRRLRRQKRPPRPNNGEPENVIVIRKGVASHAPTMLAFRRPPRPVKRRKPPRGRGLACHAPSPCHAPPEPHAPPGERLFSNTPPYAKIST